jgi:hypothetical protein
MLKTHALEKYRDKNRLLLIFAPSPQDPRYLEQRRLLEGSEMELDERDLRVLEFFEDGSQAAAWERFEVAPGMFIAVLIGKDGDEKERFMAPANSTELFALIDRMPMRRRELRKQTR